MSQPATATEGGIRSTRYEFVREDVPGEFVEDPEFMHPSDNVVSFEWSPDGGVEPREGLGTPDVVRHDNGPESHDLTLEYDLQRFPVDGTGEPLDLSGDGLLRVGPQNALPNTHTVVRRQSADGLSPSQTVNGDESRDTRIFTVCLGGKIDSLSYNGDPSSDQPVVTNVDYMLEKGRQYQVDQPDEESILSIENTGTSPVDVTIEDEDAETTETLTVDGGETEVTVDEFADIDAVMLDTDIDGNVIISEDEGVDLCIIKGSDHYGHGEGDRGIPALGSGSHADPIDEPYEMILEDELQQPVGETLAFEINSVEYSVNNNVDGREQLGTPRMALSAGSRDIEVTTTIIGESESVRTADHHLSVTQNDIRWIMVGGYIQADNAALTDFGGVNDEVGESAMALDNTFTGEGITVTAE